MGRLGLDFLESVGATDEMDLDKELAAEAELDQDVDMDQVSKTEDSIVSPTDSMPDVSDMNGTVRTKPEPSPPPKLLIPAAPSPSTSSAPPGPDELGGLSARERNRLKRKRKPGNFAFVAAPPPQNTGAKYNPTPAGPSNK
jgi:TATA-binding protein-associated factor